MTKQNETVKSWKVDDVGQVEVSLHTTSTSPYEPRLREIAKKIAIKAVYCTTQAGVELEALAALRSELSGLLDKAGETVRFQYRGGSRIADEAHDELLEELAKWKR